MVQSLLLKIKMPELFLIIIYYLLKTYVHLLKRVAIYVMQMSMTIHNIVWTDYYQQIIKILQKKKSFSNGNRIGI